MATQGIKTDEIIGTIHFMLVSPNVGDSNGEPANLVDVVDRWRESPIKGSNSSDVYQQLGRNNPGSWPETEVETQTQTQERMTTTMSDDRGR